MPKILLAIFLAVLTFGVYADSLNGDFLIDDDAGIVFNQRIQDAKRYFAQDFGIRPGVIQEVSRVINWHFSRTDTYSYHLTALISHILVVILLFCLLNILFKKPRLSFFSALIFALHPIHTEAVSWISADGYIYGAVFSLTSFIFYVRAGRSYLNFFLSIVFFGLTLLSGNAVAMLPPLFFVYDVFFRPKDQDDLRLRRLRMVFLWLLLALAILYVSTFFFTRTTTIRTILRLRGYSYLIVAVKAFAYYVGLLYLPLQRGLYHPFAFNTMEIQRISPLLFVSLAILAMLIFVLIRSHKRFPELSFGLAVFFIGYLPYSNIVPICNIISERYLYLASLGSCIAVAAVFLKGWDVLNKIEEHKRGLRIFAVSAMTLYLCSYAYLTAKRNIEYNDIFTYWRTNINNFPDGYMVYNNLAGSYFSQGNIVNAIGYCWITLMINPDQPHVWCNLGLAYRQRNDFANALYAYEQALKYDKSYWPAVEASRQLRKIVDKTTKK